MRKIVIFIWQSLLRIRFKIKRNSIPMTSRVDFGCTLTNCKIGKYCYIRSGAQFNHVVTGNYCSFAADVQIGGMEHSMAEYSTSAQIYRDKCVSSNDTIIGHDVWIAAGSIIRQGVIIGNGAVVGANSFVNKDVPSYAVVAGSPAKILKFRFDKNTQKEIQATKYWDMKPNEARLFLDSLKKRIEAPSNN